MRAPRIRALIFDFDGLIVDTETPAYDSWRALYQEYGHALALETYVECVGSTSLRFDPLTHLQTLLGKSRPLEVLPLQQRHQKNVRDILDRLDTLPGVRERIAEALEAGLHLAVASSSDSAWIDSWLARLGLAAHFSVVRTRDHVRETKPSPELFLAAAEELGVAPEEALVLEDSHHGLQAAHAAGMPCVIIPNQVTGNSDFSKAALILRSLADLALHEILTKLDDENPGIHRSAQIT